MPNRTPQNFKADTSTEICMNFVAEGAADYELVINNHADVDGVLSVFTLLHPKAALAHRSILVSAAGMGDFYWWGNDEAQVLFQSLTRQIDELVDANTDPQTVYERCLVHVGGVIDRGFSDPDIEKSLVPLRKSVEWVEQGRIRRREYHARFVHYAIPGELGRERLDAALRVPSFNARISDDVLFWPQARARWDKDKVQLVSVETSEGWYYDLWYPSYVWADTPYSWRPPGLNFAGHSNGYTLSYQPLDAAAGEFQRRESNGATWHLESDLSFEASSARGFPVVLSSMNGDTPAPSSLSPDFVADRLAEMFLF